MSELERDEKRYAEIADFVKCDIDSVRLWFDRRPPSTLTPEAMDSTADLFNATDKFEILVAKVRAELENLPSEVYDRLIIAGGITAPQLENYEELVGEVKETIFDRNAPFDRRGGKNWAAYDLAIKVRSLFQEIGEAITYGHNSGRPSTKFGKTVEFVFQQFEIEANWREPTSKTSKLTERIK